MQCRGVAFAPLGGSGVSAEEPPAPPSFPDAGELPRDIRLQTRMTFNLTDAKLREVLSRIEDATQVRLDVTDNVDLNALAFHSLKAHNLPAWSVMQQLTQSPAVQGHWEENGLGYRLIGTVTPAPKPSPSAWPSIRVCLTAACLVLIVGVCGCLWWRMRRIQAAKSPRVGLADLVATGRQRRAVRVKPPV